MTNLDFDSMDSMQYDNVLNDISREIFGTDDKELDNERVRLMNWAVVNLLLNKGIITQEEYTSSVEEATTFFKMLKRRYRLQNTDNTDDSTETS